MRPGIEPTTSWFLVVFVSAVPQQELQDSLLRVVKVIPKIIDMLPMLVPSCLGHAETSSNEAGQEAQLLREGMASPASTVDLALVFLPPLGRERRTQVTQGSLGRDREFRRFFKASQRWGKSPDGDKTIKKKKKEERKKGKNQDGITVLTKGSRRLAHTSCLQPELFLLLKMKFGNCKLSDAGSVQSKGEPAKSGLNPETSTYWPVTRESP